MRLLIVNLLATALMLFSAASASAYVLSLVPTTPTTVAGPGAIISFDVFLDTEGASGITLFSASLTFDPLVVAYRNDLSDANDYYPLYAPQVGKTQPATWLSPIADPPGLWPAPPAGLQQINVDFIEVNLNNTVATGTNVFIATLAFEAVGFGVSNGTFSFDNGGNIFSVNQIPVEGTLAFTSGDATMTVIPEPTTALLVGLGLVGLGVAGRRRA